MAGVSGWFYQPSKGVELAGVGLFDAWTIQHSAGLSAGNDGDGREGVCLGGAVGTYLRGPCLPRNPGLADFPIGAAPLAP